MYDLEPLFPAYLTVLILPLGRKLKKRCTSRWKTRMKPRLISMFMHAQAVRAEDDEQRINVTVSCSLDSVNTPI